MKAYTYDTAGHYLQDIEVDENPMEPGRYLLPPNATFVAPPADEAGKHPRWSGRAWDLVTSPSHTRR